MIIGDVSITKKDILEAVRLLKSPAIKSSLDLCEFVAYIEVGVYNDLRSRIERDLKRRRRMYRMGLAYLSLKK